MTCMHARERASSMLCVAARVAILGIAICHLQGLKMQWGDSFDFRTGNDQHCQWTFEQIIHRSYSSVITETRTPNQRSSQGEYEANSIHNTPLLVISTVKMVQMENDTHNRGENYVYHTLWTESFYTHTHTFQWQQLPAWECIMGSHPFPRLHSQFTFPVPIYLTKRHFLGPGIMSWSAELPI